MIIALKELFSKNIFLVGCFLLFLISCNKVTESSNLVDNDGYVYKTVQIGEQIWMAENLRTSRYNDGKPIPNVTNGTNWANQITGAFCYYDNNSSYNAVYGKLYNWYAVNSGKLCPKGWHIPTKDDWTELADYLGGTAGGKMKATGNKKDGTGLWNSPNNGATNESGFTGLPGGGRTEPLGTFYDMGSHGVWWSATEYAEYAAWNITLHVDYNFILNYAYHKSDGFSCRCVKD